MAAGLSDRQRCEDAGSSILELCAWSELWLRVERVLGYALRRTVRRGGSGSKSLAATSKRGGASRPLPIGISKHLATKLRSLASLSSETFDEYARANWEQRLPLTRSGAVSASGAEALNAQVARPRVLKKAARAVDPPESVVKLAEQFMGRADLHIGNVALDCLRSVGSDAWGSSSRGGDPVTQSRAMERAAQAWFAGPRDSRRCAYGHGRPHACHRDEARVARRGVAWNGSLDDAVLRQPTSRLPTGNCGRRLVD